MKETDWAKWKRKQLWTLIEAACLLSGREPVSAKQFDNVGATAGLVYADLKDAIDLKKITAIRSRGTGLLRDKRVKPAEVVERATRQGYEIPPGLADLSPPKEEKPLGERERTVLLNIIGGLLGLMLGRSSSGKPLSVWESQTAIIDQLLQSHEGAPGIKKRTLEQKFAEAKRSIDAT